jgi:hypothetical protein
MSTIHAHIHTSVHTYIHTYTRMHPHSPYATAQHGLGQLRMYLLFYVH